jgi:putative ABC transport system permease protein
MNNGVIPISVTGLILCLLPLFLLGWIYHRTNKGGGLVFYATTRMLVQLVLMGFALVFIFKIESAWMILPVLIFILSISSWIALRPLDLRNRRRYLRIFASIGLACGGMLFYVLLVVIHPDPLYQPRYFIPLAGMIFSNAMTAISLAGERFDNEIARGVIYEKALSIAFKAALIPQINSFLAVGLVSLPGMMTGQIIAGVEPLLAIRYQIVVMAMIFGSAGLSVALFLHWEKLARPSKASSLV